VRAGDFACERASENYTGHSPSSSTRAYCRAGRFSNAAADKCHAPRLAFTSGRGGAALLRYRTDSNRIVPCTTSPRGRHVWLVSIASVATQAALSLWLLRREFRTRLRAAPEAGLAPA